MTRHRRWFSGPLAAIGLLPAAALVPVAASAAGMAVDISTDRGNDAVYQPGDRIQLSSRCSDDANLLVYEIDSEGHVNVLFPFHGSSAYVAGRQTLAIPDEKASDELVVQEPVGVGYIVAVASREPFRDLPWYLRPYNPQAEGVGYVGTPEEEEGVTADGKIVGDPFVAMERIRRRVLAHPEDPEAFATAYTSYYVRQAVRYPRYLCDDCHRPSHWAWWDGYDPYYTTCSVFSFGVNFGWAWGPGYWFGTLPYYTYYVRPGCPPYYNPWVGYCYSSWDGYGRWATMWSGHLTRYKSPPPPGYVPPSQHKYDPGWQKPGGPQPPPGFLTAADVRSQRGFTGRIPVSKEPGAQIVPRADWRPGGELRKPVATRSPVTRSPAGLLSENAGSSRSATRGERPPRIDPPRGGQSAPVTAGSQGRARYDQPDRPRNESNRGGASAPVTAGSQSRGRYYQPGRGGASAPVSPGSLYRARYDQYGRGGASAPMTAGSQSRGRYYQPGRGGASAPATPGGLYRARYEQQGRPASMPRYEAGRQAHVGRGASAPHYAPSRAPAPSSQGGAPSRGRGSR